MAAHACMLIHTSLIEALRTHLPIIYPVENIVVQCQHLSGDPSAFRGADSQCCFSQVRALLMDLKQTDVFQVCIDMTLSHTRGNECVAFAFFQ